MCWLALLTAPLSSVSFWCHEMARLLQMLRIKGWPLRVSGEMKKRRKLKGIIMIKTALLSVSVMLVSAMASAQGLRLGVPGYAGSGCPAGSASVTLSPDETELSILFDSYIAEAGETTGRPLDRKACNITLPVQVPQGYSVAIFKVDYRGFNAISRGDASTTFRAEYFWAGTRGPVVSRTFRGPMVEDYTMTNELITAALVWSDCGDSLNLRANTSITASAGRSNQQTMITVDSADVSAGLIYQLQWRRCR